MNRNGLELVKQLSEVEPIMKKLISMGDLPPMFTVFLTLYKVGYQAFSYEKIVLNDDDMDEYLLSKITMYNNVEIDGGKYTGSLDYIFPYIKLEEEIEKYHLKSEKWNELGFIQIGLMHYGDILLLGINNDKSDEIWRYGQGMIGNVASKLDDNIFDFMKRLKESISYEDLEDWRISQSDIYKNLGEDFWRVREKEE
ncbi:MAG: hypothetical protein R2771_05105 [Saprospiraceae bacterium]